MFALQRFLVLSGVMMVFSVSAAQAGAAPALADHAKGDPKAPITVVEYSSMTCSHCADFYNNVLPELEKRYISTGKVRLIYRDFPVDGIALKGAALAECMPDDKFFPFISVIYHNRNAWLGSPKPETVLQQYAMLAGLSAEKSKACLEDTAMFDKLVAARTEAMSKYNIEGTPTFIINDSADHIMGSQHLEVFEAAFDKILAQKKQ